jgi:hypothetical protein
VGNIDCVAGRIRDLGEREAQLTGSIQGDVSMYLCTNIRAHTADMAHFVKDSTELRQEQQQGET